MPGRRRLVGTVLLLLLVVLCVLRSWVGTRLDSFTVDEPWHVVAGTAYARTGDFHLNPEHPPLVKLWVGHAMPDDFSLRPAKGLSEKTQERTWVEETMFKDNEALRAQQYARAAMWTLNGLLLLALALLLWRACGWVWAAATLAFLAIEPTISAHLPVVMTDLPLALTLSMAVVAAGLLAARWQWRWVAGCGIAIGLALAAKRSALAGLRGVYALLLCACGFGWGDRRWLDVVGRVGKLCTTTVIAIVVLWALYGFHFHAAADGSDAFNHPMPDKLAELHLTYWRDGIAFANRWHLLPRAYLWGLADTVRTGVEGRGISEHFIWGTQYSGKAPWFAWPAIVIAKVPLALWLLVAPQTRASSLSAKVMDYIYKENGSDWALVARRLEEVAALMPQKIDSGVELGNAYLRLGDGVHAIQAYRRLLDQRKMPLDAELRQQLEQQVSAIAASADPAKLTPVRDPWLE